MKNIGKLFLSALIIAISAVAAFGGLPQTINHQGFLRDSAGIPVTSQVNITFRLYTVVTGGTPIWMETKAVTPQNGIYSLLLGVDTPLDSQVFNSSPLYLGVQIGSDAEMPARQQISSVPFAFRAGVAESVAANSIDTNAVVDGAVTAAKLAVGAVTTEKIAAGSITANELATNAVTSQSIAWHSITPDRLDTAYVKTAGDSMSGQLAVVSGAPGVAVDIRGTNSASTVEAVKVTNSGKGPAFASYAASTEGVAGLFSVIASLNNSDALTATTTGGGNAGTFTILNPASTGSALHVSTNGPGSAIKAFSTGGGLSGQFIGDVSITGLLTAGGLAAASVDTQALQDAAITDAKINSPISPTKGGTGLNTSATAAGALLRTTGTGVWSTLPIGVSGQVLKVAAGMPVWAYSGTVTSVTAGSGLTATPSPIVSSGTIAIDTSVVPTLAAANSFTGTQTIQSSSNTAQGLVVRGAGLQNANLQEWQNSSGGVVASISPAGDITSGGNLILPVNSANTGIIYYGSARMLHGFDSNFFAGIGSGNSSTTGTENTGIGGSSLVSITTGKENTAVGYQSLTVNDAGNFNTAFGTFTLGQNRTGGDNTAVGRGALFSNIIGSDNTSTGSMALTSNIDGDRNTASGSNSLFYNESGSSNSAHGFRALYANISGFNNTSVGTFALLYNETGNNNTAIGYDSGEKNSSGSANTFLGSLADSNINNLSNATAIGYNAIVDANNKVRIGNSSVSVIEGQVPWSNPSDIRLKTNVAEVTHGLDFIRQLRPVEYRMKNGNGRKDFGFVAQEIEALIGTEYNMLGIGGDEERTLTLRYTDFVAPLVKAVQEQQAIIEQLKAELTEIKKLLRR